jgi:hypothetical protein
MEWGFVKVGGKGDQGIRNQAIWEQETREKGIFLRFLY